MADYRLILSLIVQGYSYRQIEAMASCSHRAIAKALVNVESGVKIVSNWIIHYLTDRTSDGFVIHLDSPPLGMVEE